MRGDRPGEKVYWTIVGGFTPHARGSTVDTVDGELFSGVYPACAGIDLPPYFLVAAEISLPRMRGDRPGEVRKTRWYKTFTPHARGST